MTETPRKASNIRQAVDFGALVAFMAAYAVNRFARGLDGQEALVQATWVLVGASALALIVGFVVERRLAPLPLRRYPFKYLLGEAIRITDQGWRGLTLRYGLYFAAVCIVNEIVWRTQSDDTWVAFRGGLWIASAVFGIWQVFFIMKHLTKDDDPAPVSPDPGL